MDDAAVDPAGDHGTATLDAKYVLNRHQERLVFVPLRQRDVLVNRLQQLPDALVLLSLRIFALALHRLKGAATDNRDVIAIELLAGEVLTQLQLHQIEELRVIHHIDLVQIDDDAGHLHLASEQDVLLRLRHGPIGCGDDEDGAVHLRCAGNHVLDVVGVAGTVHMGVVTILRLILHVLDSDRDPTLALFRSVIDAVEVAIVRSTLIGEHLGDG